MTKAKTTIWTQPLIPKPADPQHWAEPTPMPSTDVLIRGIMERLETLWKYVLYSQTPRKGKMPYVIRLDPVEMRRDILKTFECIIDHIETVNKKQRFPRDYSRDDAAREIAHLRQEVWWVRIRRHRDKADREEWQRSQDWCEVDKAETDAEVMESLSRLVLRTPVETYHPKDSDVMHQARDTFYIARLRLIRKSFSWSPTTRVADY